MVKILKSDGFEIKEVENTDTIHLSNTLSLNNTSKIEFNSSDPTQLTIVNAGTGNASLSVDNKLEVQNPDGQSHIDIFDGGSGKPAYIALYSDTGVPYYLFSEPDGTLRISPTIPTSNLDGNVVGTQT
jgi:Tfp pilus assembly protein PilW